MLVVQQVARQLDSLMAAHLWRLERLWLCLEASRQRLNVTRRINGAGTYAFLQHTFQWLTMLPHSMSNETHTVFMCHAMGGEHTT
jgi:hypothetical protein